MSDEEIPTLVGLAEPTTDNLYPALFQCFFVILSGYIAGRCNVVTPLESKGIGTFVGTFALPSLIFLSLARLDFSIVNWTFLGAMFLAKAVIFYAVMVITLLISRPVNLGKAGIFAIFCTQSNDFALGFPIIDAIYSTSHPEYALYLYLMAPISLVMLNPVAFVLMEIGKQRISSQTCNDQSTKISCLRLTLLWKVIKGVVFNPIVLMTVLGIIGNIIFKHKIPVYIEGLLDVFGSAFSGCALFLLGLKMVGQFHRLKGPALVLPFVLIMVKLIVLPVAMKEAASSLSSGVNSTDTSSLSTYAFLYGTIPSAPAVFVFSNQYQLEVDLIASSMVICTFVSAPMMVISAEMISITKDYAAQLKTFGFDLSIASLLTSIWVMIVFILTKKYKRMPHRITICLVATQIVLSLSVIWGGPKVINNEPGRWNVVQQCLRVYSMFACLVWTSMLAVGLLLLQSGGGCVVARAWPWLAGVAWGLPAVAVAALAGTSSRPHDLDGRVVDAVRLGLLAFSLTVTAASLVLYLRFRKRSAQFEALSAEVSGQTDAAYGESSTLVGNAAPTASDNVTKYRCSEDVTAIEIGRYGTMGSDGEANACCINGAPCNNASVPIAAGSHDPTSDIEDIHAQNECEGCPGVGADCACLDELEQGDSAGQLGGVAVGAADTGGKQLMKHTILIISYTLTMFISITYTIWGLMMDTNNGIFIEIEFLDILANYGQGLVVFILFGLDPNELVIPALKFLKTKWYGSGGGVVLPHIEELDAETRQVCEQFSRHHLERCRQAIAKDTRWRMKAYRGVFRGACLARWLEQCGLARDAAAAELYGRRLLDGRVIRHLAGTRHFTDSNLLYTFTEQSTAD